MFDIPEDSSLTSPILAKGRGGTSGGGISIDASWYAPPLVKTFFAFQIIWFILLLIESLLILRGLKLISKSPRSSKAPYVLAALVAVEASIYHLIGGIYTRQSGLLDFIYNPPSKRRYLSAITFLFSINISFQPMVLLWLCHLRGVLTSIGSDTKENKNSFVASTWKKTVDWSLFVILFAISFAYSSLRTIDYNSIITSAQLNAIEGLNRTKEAFIVVFAINIVVSLICLKVAQRRAGVADKVVTRLLVISVPFVVINAAETIATEILTSTRFRTGMGTEIYVVNSLIHPYGDYELKFPLAVIIIEGTCRVMIFAGIIATMKFASAPQSASYNKDSVVNTGGYSANNQYPFYPAAPPYQTPPMTTPPQQQGWNAPPMIQQGHPYQVPYNHPTNQGWQR
ncbi:hypothetical protein FRC18_003144 [Serendipita sp. 400]|nr:hypothetical protein FRC18_003144 [Serendipita sp. 400]